jgi:adenosylcobinamide-GDP ribazoletransferase
MSRLADERAAALLALGFLTRLPLPADAGHTPEREAASPRWYPAVGLLVGAISGGAFWLAALVLPPTLAALAATAVGLVLTGCLHEDGLADACDGLGGGATPERALAIMRDSRLGTYGAIGLGLVLGAKVLALAALPAAAVPALLVAGHAASRASMVVVMATSRYVRPQGLGSATAGGLPARTTAFAVAIGLLGVALAAPFLPAPAVAGSLLGLGAGHAARLAFERRLGGYTGDCLGLVQQTSELGLYLGALACL